MAPPRRPGLTIHTQVAPPGDAMVVLVWTAVPMEHCTPEMLAFRASSNPLRASHDALRGVDGLPRSDGTGNPTMQHWQSGGVVLFGYSSSRAAQYARRTLERVYLGQAGRIAVRDRPKIRMRNKDSIDTKGQKTSIRPLG